ncbi:MAG: hypothetical protein EBU85_07060, partial [Actinobacteria bacterium]|nr:hypothetical protein [Actinomycetota bacterium]
MAAALEDVNAHVLVLAGTITHALEPVVCAAFEQMPEPRVVIAFGACTISGGPYWDSYSVVPGSPIPVDVHVPGCPPPPESLALACEQVRDWLLDAQDKAANAAWEEQAPSTTPARWPCDV